MFRQRLGQWFGLRVGVGVACQVQSRIVSRRFVAEILCLVAAGMLGNFLPV